MVHHHVRRKHDHAGVHSIADFHQARIRDTQVDEQPRDERRGEYVCRGAKDALEEWLDQVRAVFVFVVAMIRTGAT